ncbi:Bug family tripartite tricarboxylate transporter substrate binding protein [Antarcticirhabdus aurantiaca]|uniref:Tripartite tricarboxylate transporter substrate binding protein n=1 Tax=Antarcticirhabdus aurantiaca TaxID=2606717 RepID=A0ACD4NVK6_9HYPH|nr:tripartite tricarboxylate transporter substrate binding protein [Antarcticirhabdus aurantiaca]WAJ30642.1 tripartite tricarboxylate transporter substrate binding protein [Jeongeuplla avenae]
MNGFTRRAALRLGAIGGAMLLSAALLAPAPVLAQEDYPSRPINVVVPFATGGYNDRLARAFAPYLEKELGQPLVIINQEGAGTQLGHTYALQQDPDGYTILCTSVSPYIPLSIFLQNAPYKLEDFAILNLPSRDYTLAATSADSEIESFAAAIEQLKADPSSLSIGVQPASADYANMMLTMKAAGIDPSALRIVTYDGGGPARNAAAGAQVDIAFVGGEGFLPLKDKIKPLAMYAKEAPAWWPGAPTIGSTGIEQEFVDGSQRGWVVASAVKTENPEIYAKILAAVEKASKNPDAIKALELQELATTWYGPEASQQAFIDNAATMEKHQALLKGE